MNLKHGDYVKLTNNKIYKVNANEKGTLTLRAPLCWGGAVEYYQMGCWGGPIVEMLPPDKKPPHILADPRGYFEFYNMLDTWEILLRKVFLNKKAFIELIKNSGIVANEGSKPLVTSN